MVADSGSASPEDCQRWLPIWLPWISLPSLMFERAKTESIARWPTAVVSANHDATVRLAFVAIGRQNPLDANEIPSVGRYV